MRLVTAATALLAATACAHGGGGGPAAVPPEMVRIPSGGFTMGWSRGPLNERPSHEVLLGGFLIDRTEVTAADFAEFLSARGNPEERYLTPDERSTVVLTAGADAGSVYAARPGYERHPANNVSWEGAQAYCAWRGKRLPTEAEWEKAARGTDARRFPWGKQAPSAERARFGRAWGEDGIDVLTAVDAQGAGASAYGVLNMSGNVMEWVNDWYRQNLCDFCNPEQEADLPLARLLSGDERSEPGARPIRQVPPREDPQGPGAGAFRVLRGGSWKELTTDGLRTTHRFWLAPGQRFPDTGFRCAR